MSGGCDNGVLHGPSMVCVELINMRNMIEKTLNEYSV